MLGSKNNLFVDRRVYAFKGTWKDPRQDKEIHPFYYIKEHTLVSSYENGKETMKSQYIIVVYGEHPFCERDYFTLQTGEKYRISDITNNYMETNIAVRDLLKQKIESMVLVLE